MWAIGLTLMSVAVVIGPIATPLGIRLAFGIVLLGLAFHLWVLTQTMRRQLI